MQLLNKPCQNCHKPMNGGVYRASHICPHCLCEHEGGSRRARRKQQKLAGAPRNIAPQHVAPSVVAQLPEATRQNQESPAATPGYEAVAPGAVALSSKPADEYGAVTTVKAITAECVLKIKATPDLFSDGKFLGTKSETVRAALAQGRKHALAQLREKAQSLDANLVSDVAVNNAIKKADSQNLNIIVQATGVAGLISELVRETA